MPVYEYHCDSPRSPAPLSWRIRKWKIGVDRLSDSAPGRCALPSRRITARVRSTAARAGGGEP